LHVLRESTLSQFRVVECPISSPFHSAKLFTAYDISQILEGTSAERWSNVVHLPVISSATGKLSAARTYRALLEEALEDMLLRPIIWEDVVYGVAYVNRLGKDSKISLRPVGTNAEAALCTALERKGFNAVVSSFKPVLNSRDQFLEEGNVPVKTPSGNSRIAIVGMSGRFPEADNLDEYWNILLQGLDVHKIVPPSRWSMNHVDPEGKRKNTSRTPFGCWLKQPGQFDATFFEISPREALQVDPASRIALMTTYEAMEQAGLVPDATPSTRRDRVGVFYGVTSNDWMEVNSSQKIDTYFIPGGCRAFIPGRVNYCFKFSGPSYSMDTACSSSLAAIHTACNSLWQGNVDTAIAGGTNVLTNPDYTAGLDKGHFLSRTGNCKPFDENADGYCRGEGVCTIILKRLEDALAENDPILGVISGAYTNHSAEAESITRPRAESQMAIFNKIMNDAGVLPEEVGYVEMHGTGTQAGDTVEMRSVLETFAPNYIGLSAENKPLRQPIYLGSAKANIGHGEASSGVSSLAKALLMLKNDIIPPHSGIKTKLNSRFPSDLQERNVHIASTAIAWPKAHRKPRRIFVNNFSAAGGNSALLIEDAPLTVSTRSTDTRSSHIVTVTAKSSDALWRNAESLANFLDGKTTESQITLPSLSYTTTARRIHHPHRLAVRGSSLQEIRSSLREELTRRGNSKGAPTGVTFAFTGNGTQYPGMGKQLFEAFPTFRADIMRLDQLLQSEGFPSVLPFCSQSSIEDLECPPVVVQLAAICLEIALARLWISWGVIPQAVIGHSLGEYAALNVAGVLSDSDTIYLVGKRASLLEQKCTTNTHSMLAVAAPQATVERLVKRSGCEVACINGPEDIVLSGPIDEIREMKSQLENKSIKATLLPVHYAFHSSQVDVILDEFEALCHGIKFQKPKIPVLSPLKGSIINNIGTFGPKYLSDHCRKPVNIVDTLRLARDRGLITKNSLVVEIGPQPIYGRMVRSTLGSAAMTVPSIKRNQDMWPILTGTLSSLYTSGVEINWGEYHRGFQSSLQVIPLPAYSWDLKDYWIQYVNDWSLRKGEPAGVTSDLPLVPVQGLGSSIHKIVEESIQGKSGAVILETDLSDRHIKDIATGHVVNDIPLATPVSCFLFSGGSH
jgi:acyl transferase domain-containing protein